MKRERVHGREGLCFGSEGSGGESTGGLRCCRSTGQPTEQLMLRGL